MPSRAKSLVGLDIEPHGVTAAQVAVVDGTLAVRRAAHVPLESGAVRDGEVLDPEAVVIALKELWRREKGLPKRVRVGVANQKIVVRIMDLPPLADARELEAAVRFRAQDEIPMPLDSAVLDWHALDIVETTEGPRQRVLLVAARRDMVERVLAIVRAAGLRCEGIDLSAFALVRALHQPAHDELGHVLYLSIGGLTNLAVAEGTTCLFTRATGGGVDAFAVELAERRGITLDEAQEVLEATPVPRPDERVAAVGWGDVPDPAARPLPGGRAQPEPEPEPEVAPPAPAVADDPIVAEAREVLAEGVRKIAAEVRTSLDFHSAQGGHAAVGRVVLTGPATVLPGFAEALGVQLKLDVEAVSVAGVPGHAPHVAVAAGLAVAEAPA